MNILHSINSPDDLKSLSIRELEALSGDLRSFLIENISKTGGHLASNLGVVEITLAIHRVFDTSRDRLVFDVGHQCYAHKIITGRRDKFDTLRTYKGISGFPKPSESCHDAFIAGHASTAVSVALGMARARDQMGEDYHVAALLGDGALTGGLAYEALNDAGQSGIPLIVILNDNGMSITKNVGGLSKHLTFLRTRPKYLKIKDAYRRFVCKVPGGKTIYRISHNIKTVIRDALLPGSFFESIGFTYLGPVDGHDINEICRILEAARDMKRPTLIHLNTTKGKGYRYSEDNSPEYHGVSEFDIATGKSISAVSPTFSSVFGNQLAELARRRPNICAITAAMQTGTGLDRFAEEFPCRFFDVGIAEEHAVSMSAGMAKQGLIPVCAIYSTFLQRAYDMLIHDVALSDLHVILAVDRAGLSGEDGETHHGVFDVGFLCQIPKMKVLCPSNFIELEKYLEFAIDQTQGPVAIRYPRGAAGSFSELTDCFGSTLLREGRDITLVSYGMLINNVLEAARQLSLVGISAEVLKLSSISPLDTESVISSAAKTGMLLVLEDTVMEGSVGLRLAAAMAMSGTSARIKLINLGDNFIPHGKTSTLQSEYGLSAAAVAQTAAAELRHGIKLIK